MHKVVIVQEYVPHYRVPFFDALRDKGLQGGVDIRVAYGAPGSGLAKRNDEASLDFGIPIPQRERRILGRRLVVRRISDAIAGADLVILEQARRNIDAYASLAFRLSGGPAIALWGHGKDYTRASSAIEKQLSRWLTAKADWFFAYTDGGRKAVVADGFPMARTTVVQNSIDSSALRESVENAAPDQIEAFSKRYDLRGQTALYLGALDASKRLEFLKQAADGVQDKASNFRLLIAGDGELRSQVEEWDNKFPWVGYLGPVTGKQKAIALASAQVLAIPGRVGLVAVDSFAAGTPIITTDWPWHAPEFEYLENGKNAVVSSDQSDAYAKALLELLRNRSDLDRLRLGAKANADIYSIDAMSTNFLEGIRGAITARSK